MLTAHPPALSGVCTGLVVQEYWWAGTLCEPAHLIFLQLDHSVWHRFFIDAGDPFWSVVDAPDAWDTTPSDEHHYPQREIAAECGGATLTLRNEDDRNALSIVHD